MRRRPQASRTLWGDEATGPRAVAVDPAGRAGDETATVPRRRGQHPRASSSTAGPRGRYGILLALLILTYLLSAFTSGDWVGAAQLGLFAATGLLALRSSRLPRRRTQVIAIVGLSGSAAALGLALARPNEAAVAAATIWTGLVLLATVVIIVRRILSFSTVTVQSIYGAISAYLIIGLMFAAFFAADSLLTGGHFFAHHQSGNSKTFQYFSFTTLTTLGYGDFTAVGNGGRAIAMLEALTGQVFLATLVARLVAAFRTPAAQAVATSSAETIPAAPSRSARRPASSQRPPGVTRPPHWATRRPAAGPPPGITNAPRRDPPE